MENITLKLESLWLSKEEIQIYLVCLEYGWLAISSISRHTKIARVNCYYHAEKLLEKGYISSYSKSGTKVFTSENPRVFINTEQEKLNIAKEVFPELLAMYWAGSNKPRIQFFEWKAGIKNIFGRFLAKENTEIVSFSNFDNLSEFFKDTNFLETHFHARADKSIKTRFISPSTSDTKNFIDQALKKYIDTKLLEVFLISSKEFFFKSEITIFHDSIAIFNFSSEQPIWVLIENKDLYSTQKAIFDLAWLGATSFITN